MNPLGLVFGILFLGSIVGILWWMFAAGPARPMSRAASSRIKGNCIIVPLVDSPTSRQAIEFACGLASERHAELVLAHVIEIPMTLGLDVPLEAAEDHGRLILKDGENLVRKFNIPVESYLIRHRTITEAILNLAQETGAETIVMGVGTPPWWSLSRIERNVAELLRRAPCQVVVARAAVAV